MTDHSNEPHKHTVTFTDNNGQSHSFEIDCPASGPADFGRKIEATGADSVNELAIDGKKLPFERAFVLLGESDQLDRLGKSYMTSENLVKVMIAMGVGE